MDNSGVNQIIQWGIFIFSYSVLCFITVYYMAQIYKPKEPSQKRWPAGIGYVLITCMFRTFVMNEILIGIIQTALLFILMYYIFKSGWLRIVLFLLIEEFVFLVSESLGAGIIMILFSDHVAENILLDESPLYTIPAQLIVYPLVLMGMTVITKLWRRALDRSNFQAKNQENELHHHNINVVEVPLAHTILLCLAVLLNVMSILVNARMVVQTGFGSIDAYISYITPIALFVLFCGYLFYSNRYYAQKEEIQRANLVSSYLEKDMEYYKNLEQQQIEIRKMKHDMKNHLLVLSKMDAQGKNADQQQRQSQADQSIHMESVINEQKNNYVYQLIKEIDQKEVYEDSENGIVDIILYEKMKEARQKQIEIKASLEHGILKEYEQVSMCTILTNAIDNSIEACMKLQKAEQNEPLMDQSNNSSNICKCNNSTITIKAARTSVGIIMVFENAMPGKLLMNQNIIQTTKSDKSQHGYGISNMKDAVERLHGDMDISVDQERFRLSIRLPLI